MPDSQLPIQGLASQRERDLEALLSGEAGYPAAVHGPVAGVLAALRAAPAPDEIDGEAAARAAFRFFMLPEAGPAGDAHPSAPLPQVSGRFHPGAVAGAGRPDEPGPTVVLPRAVPRGPRHARPRRPAPWPGRWPVMAAAGGAAAAVIVGVAALAGAFSGPGGQPGPSGLRTTAQSTSASSHRATSSVLGTATARPTPRPTPVSPQTLCQQARDYVMHPPANRSAEDAVVQQLSKLAGGQRQIIGYCVRQLGLDRAHGDKAGFQGGAGGPAAGNQPGGGGFGDHGASRSGREGSGARSLSAGLLRPGRTGR